MFRWIFFFRKRGKNIVRPNIYVRVSVFVLLISSELITDFYFNAQHHKHTDYSYGFAILCGTNLWLVYVSNCFLPFLVL